MSISVLAAAILFFRVNGLTYVIDKITIETADLENMGLAVGIVVLCLLEPEIVGG